MDLVNNASLAEIRIPKKDCRVLGRCGVEKVEDLTKISRKELEEIIGTDRMRFTLEKLDLFKISLHIKNTSDTGIHGAGFSTRVSYVLSHANINNISDLLDKTQKDLESINGLSNRMVWDIIERLNKLGLSLKNN